MNKQSIMCFLITFMVLIFTSSVYAAEPFQEREVTVGTVISLNRPDTIYSVDNANLASLVESKPGIYGVRCDKPGDVYVTAITKIDGNLVKFVMLAHIKETKETQEMRNRRDKLFGDVTDETTRNYIEAVVTLVNRERKKVGLQYLMIYTDLVNGANIRAKEITNSYSHTRPNGSACFTVLREKYGWMGENIAAGYQSPEAVVQGWMNSEGHRKNILNPNFKKIGVGYYNKPSSDMVNYWVQMFSD